MIRAEPERDPVVLRPAVFCRHLLDALAASEGRRRRRKRDTTPDAIGLAIKRDLLESVVAADPEPDEFEGWLLDRCLTAGPGGGGIHAMALSIWDEWKLADASPSFRTWLMAGAPSDDRNPDSGSDRPPTVAPMIPSGTPPGAQTLPDAPRSRTLDNAPGHANRGGRHEERRGGACSACKPVGSS